MRRFLLTAAHHSRHSPVFPIIAVAGAGVAGVGPAVAAVAVGHAVVASINSPRYPQKVKQTLTRRDARIACCNASVAYGATGSLGPPAGLT